jgi:putative ABC transport system permease protein
VVVINEAAARKYLPNVDPIGKRIRFWGISREIVGVVGNERFAGLAAEAPPAMYPPITQAPTSTAAVLVRTESDPRLVLSQVRAVIRGLDSDLAPFDVATLDEALTASVAQQRFLTMLLAVFATVALLLALVGVYGVVSYTVAQRTHEIGVRVALGATRGDVLRFIVGHGVRLALLGSLVGLLGALASGQLLATQLYGVSATEPVIYAVVIAGTLLVVTLASYLPARRAARITPLMALREP